LKRNWLSIPRLPKVSWVDGVVAISVFAILYVVVKLSTGMGVPFSPYNAPHIRLDGWLLPYYAGRSLLRMFIAYFFSLIFTFVYGRIAASYPIAEKIMIPLLDILQSIPVLGFLSITITGFMALFPNSLLGVECASIFAIFTGQVWNMTFSFYYSISALPNELREASTMIRLDGFARFTRLELPYAMIGLVWNSMMSFGGGWFFLAASESISVLHHNIQLPGIGSYMATAIASGNVPALIESILTMVVMIVLVDQFFWRPLVAWSQKYKMDMVNSGDDAPTSWFLQLLHRSKLAEWFSTQAIGTLFRMADNFAVKMADRRLQAPAKRPRRKTVSRLLSIVIGTICSLLLLYYGIIGAQEIAKLGWLEIFHVILLGFYTALRVFASTALSLAWTIPVGVMIGSSPKLSRIAQPLVQIVASFPANMLFPIITLFYIAIGFNFQYGSILLMMLGTQWYILFNVIAGSLTIPNDLKEATKVLRLTGWQKWKRLYLPVIFPYAVTGCITASGGAWNASILAELSSWKSHTLVASGLGAFITESTAKGNWPQIVLSITVMAAFVVVINRVVWRPLHKIAETRYRLEV